MKTFEIKTTQDVARFFSYLVFDLGIDIHPDTDFNEYVSNNTGLPTFDNREACEYNRTMEKCFEVCEKCERDIYKISLYVVGLFYYCDKDDDLAEFCFAN